MASAELRKRKREEYEMQLFGFHSRAVHATLKNTVERKIKSRCQKLGEAIEKRYKLDGEGKATLKDNMRELRRAYIQGAQPYFKNMQTIVEKYISIPNNVLLEEDKCQAVQYSDEEFEEMNEKLESLRNRLKRAHTLSVVLDKELEATKEVDEFQNTMNKVVAVIEKASSYQLLQGTEQAVERFKTLNNILETMAPKTQKQIHNPNLNYIQLKELILDYDS